MTGLGPSLSVVIPVFNGETYLADAVESVRRQAYTDLEVILVDDGSTDGTADVIRRLPPDGLHYVRQDNGGPARARNRGLARARGSIIGFLDADDLWPAGRLHRQLAVLQRDPSIDIVLGRVQLVRATGAAPGLPLEESSLPFVLLTPTAALFRRRVFERVGGFDEALRYGEDSDWFMRAREREVRVVLEQDVALLYRRHAGNMTRGRNMKELQVFEVLKRSLDRRRKGGGGAAASLPGLSSCGGQAEERCGRSQCSDDE